MKNRLLLMILAILLSGCLSVQEKLSSNDLLNWRYGDLRLLDPIDAVKPDQDLIALYSRINDQSFQIRIDFLDLYTGFGKDVYIAIDTNPGGLTQIKVDDNENIPVDISWDYLIKIPTSGNVAILDEYLSPVYGMALLIVPDTIQDRIVISFNKTILPISIGKTKLQVIITPSDQNLVADKSDPFSIDTPSPARAKVFFTFWNTFSASTPAQTLRSWEGAHAGPMSSRHGLKYLLDAAYQTKSTVLLLDLLKSDTLSALDYLNALPQIRKLADQGILDLPYIENSESFGMDDDILNPYIGNYFVDDLDIYKIWNIGSNVGSKSIDQKSILFILLKNLGNIYRR